MKVRSGTARRFGLPAYQRQTNPPFPIEIQKQLGEIPHVSDHKPDIL
jgi:hypothetical protein